MSNLILKPNKQHLILGGISIILFSSVISILTAKSVNEGPDKKDITISNLLVRADISTALTPLIVLLVLFFSLLLYSRKGIYLYTRILLLLLSFILVIIISPKPGGGGITIQEDKTNHYRIAGCIFVFFYIFTLITSYIFFNYCKKEYLLLFLIFCIYLATFSLISLLVLNIFDYYEAKRDQVETTVFAINEYNFLLLIMILIFYYALV